VKAAVAAVRRAGVEVVIATGRSPWAVVAPALALGLFGPQIVMNGGAFVSPLTGEVAWARTLSRELVIDGLVFARGMGSSPLLGFVNRLVWEGARSRDRRSPLPDFAVGPHVKRVDSLVRMAGRGPVRLYIPTAPREHARALVEAREWFGARASIVYSDEFGIEILAPRTNKGQALQRIAEARGIERMRVAAIGDGPNDREMLDYAGRSGAMLPAPGLPVARGLIPGGGTQVFPRSANDGAVEALRRFFPGMETVSERLETTWRWEAPDGRSTAVLAPSFDDDPEPDTDLSAA
jgi:hydroxymethylpyrimidine pyrophosphatase-like HAD family hydrolase